MACCRLQVLGTPTREDIHAMNPNYTEFKFPHIKAHPWSKVFSKRLPPDAVDLVSLHARAALMLCCAMPLGHVSDVRATSLCRATPVVVFRQLPSSQNAEGNCPDRAA